MLLLGFTGLSKGNSDDSSIVVKCLVLGFTGLSKKGNSDNNLTLKNSLGSDFISLL